MKVVEGSVGTLYTVFEMFSCKFKIFPKEKFSYRLKKQTEKKFPTVWETDNSY